MRQAVLRGPGELAVEERPRPDPPDDVALSEYVAWPADAARAAGATEVVVADPVAAKRRRAEAQVADAAVNPVETDLRDPVAARTDGTGVDVVEVSSAESAIAGSLGAVRRGGTVVFVGLADEAEVPLDALDIVDNELDVRGSFRTGTPTPRPSTCWPTARSTSRDWWTPRRNGPSSARRTRTS